jgi:hypothetical protein
MMEEVRLGSACESAGVHAMAGEIATIEPIIDEGTCRSQQHVQQQPRPILKPSANFFFVVPEHNIYAHTRII